MVTKRCVLVMAGLFLSLSCSDDNSDQGLSLSPVAATGRLEAVVLHSWTREAIAGVAVRVDGEERATTDAAGAVSLELPTGRHLVEVVAAGYVRWQQDLPIIDGSWHETVVLEPLSEVVAVAPDQDTTILLDNGQLVFPPGAYPLGAEVQTAWVDGASDARPGTYMFTDESGVARVAVSMVVVNVPSEPAAPVTMVFGLPPDGNSDLVLFHLDGAGVAGEPIAPLRFEGGLAFFEVPHFDSWLLTKRCTDHAAHLNKVFGAVEYRVPPDEQWHAAWVGQGLVEGTILRVPSDGAAELTYAHGGRVRLVEATTFTVTALPLPNWLESLVFSVRSRVIAWSTRLSKKFERRMGGTCSIRGSVAYMRSEPCGGEDRQRIDYQVYEGEGICMPPGEQDVLISAGQRAEGCLPMDPTAAPPVRRDGATESGCIAPLGCDAFCAQAAIKGERECLEQGGTVTSPFDTAGCLTSCKCLIDDCPGLPSCALDISCPECEAEILACDEQLLYTCDWGGWMKCARQL